MGLNLGSIASDIFNGLGATKVLKNAFGGDKKSNGNSAYKKVNFDQADKDAKLRQDLYYGNTLNSLGQESENYVGRLQNNLDKDYARADTINQQGSAQRALDNARAGLSGVDTSAQNEQSRRNAGIEANVYNEQMQQRALDMYGNSISNRISGANTIVNQNRALEVASMQAPAAQVSSGGILSGLFDGLF